MRALILVFLFLIGLPTTADARCDESDFREVRKLARDAMRCERRAIKHGRKACKARVSTCALSPSIALRDLMTGLAPAASGRRASRAELKCQLTAMRAGAKYIRRRIVERIGETRGAMYGARFVERVADACTGVTAGDELPSFGGACRALVEPGQPVPATELAYCLRASLEQIVDDASPEPLRPNIILILSDDQRPETIAYMPAVDRLADQGITFTNAFATTAICTPSRASIFSGLYAHNHGSTENLQEFDDRDTLAPWLSAAGYTTGLFGKYRNDNVAGGHVPQGWDYWHSFGRETEDDYTCEGADLCFTNYVLNENGVLRHYGEEPDDYSTDVLADPLMDFVEAERTAPFFAVYAPYASHTPAIPAPRHVGLFADLAPWRPPSWYAGDFTLKPNWVGYVRAFWSGTSAGIDDRRIAEIESLQSVDETLDRLLSLLEDYGLRDNTLVIYTSDHGVHWGEHGWTLKQSAYEESIRIPFVVSHPARTPAHAEREEMILNIDVAPTIAELAGAESGPVDGASILPLLDGPTPWRLDFLIENFVGFIVVPNAGVRTAQWKYILSDASAGVVEELYDLEADPYELSNLAFEPMWQDVKESLAARLIELQQPR